MSSRFCVAEFIDAFYANLGTRRLSLEETKNVKEKCDILSFKNVSFESLRRFFFLHSILLCALGAVGYV